VEVYIDPDRILHNIDRNIYGQFIENFHRCIYGGIYDPESPKSNESGLRKDVLGAIRNLKVPNIRWPGGCYGSAYHWENGVGDTKQRPSTYDLAWRVKDPHKFGTDEFINFCREVNTEPYFVTNAGTGTIEESANWVEYCNLDKGTKYSDKRAKNGNPEPFGVRYWSIGNENYGNWEIGAKSPSLFSEYVAESAKAMRRVDPEIDLIAPAVKDIEWVDNLITNAGEWLDYIAIHDYFSSNLKKKPNYKEVISAPYVMEDLVSFVESSIERSILSGKIQDPLKIAFDEWNLMGWAHHHPNERNPGTEVRELNDDNSQYALEDAIFVASFLNMLQRHGKYVSLANFSPLINVRGLIYTNKEDIVLRPHYHVFDLYRNKLGSHLLFSYISSPKKYKINLENRTRRIPVIEVTATKNKRNEKIVLSVLNRSDEEINSSLEFINSTIKDPIDSYTITGNSPKDYNDVSNPKNIQIEQSYIDFKRDRTNRIAFSLPSYSVNVIEMGVK